MSALQVEVDHFVSAARTMHHTVGESVRITLDGLTGSLQSNTDLVGQDAAGSAWAAGYDPAARSVLEATAEIVNAAFRTSQLFARSGANYSSAEAASATRGAERENAELARLSLPQPATRAPRLPGSAGAGNGTPAGWWLVEHTIGYVWPGGHQDRLWATAESWRRAAGGIENVAFEPVLISAGLAADRLPEADDIATVCSGFHTRLEGLARGYRSLGRACDEYAQALDECHAAARSELTELLAESAGIQVVGAIASVFTLGAAEAPTQATQAARIAATAARVGRLIEKVLAVGRRLAEGARSIAAMAEEMTRTLQELAGAKLAVAGMAHVPVVTRAGRELEAGRDAARGLRLSRDGKTVAGSAGAPRTGVVRLASKSTARDLFPEGALRDSCWRFFRKATSKTTDYRVTELADGSYRMEYFAAAHNAGYGKLYVKVVSGEGRTLAFFKDTLGPGGLIERKHVAIHD